MRFSYRVAGLVLWCLAACKPSAPTGSEGETSGESTGGSESGDPYDPGEPPPVPLLRSPPNESPEVAVETELCWELVEDPEGTPVKYRVYVDDIELTQGKLGEDGFDGPCTGPLNLEFDRDYDWEVRAFDPQAPTSQSNLSERWRFHTMWDGEQKVLLEDDFEEESGWQVGGDAATGAWVWGQPEHTEYKPSQLVTVLSQPGTCALGSGCWFTGHNPDGDPTDQDVSGGSTTLTSPPFDASGANSVLVSLSRFLYKSELEQTGSGLRFELLAPNDQAPGGFDVHVLQELEVGDEIEEANTWTPMAISGCGAPTVEEMRLRIVATDIDDGIIEAAIDSVLITGFQNDDACTPGPGALCDPNAAEPCPDELLCCSQGTLQKGIYRCETAVRDLNFDDPPAQPGDPNNGELGCDAPDITISEDGMDVYLEDIFVEDDSCTLLEGCVGGTGWRTVLRFDVQTPNVGSTDLVMGIPSNHPDLYHYSSCHMHQHFDGYANYTLLDGNDAVATGHKQAFCLVDWESWAWPWLVGPPQDGDDGQFNCFNQGISRGWQDDYEADLDCQWIDVTDVDPGNYTLRIDVNPPPPNSQTPLLIERDYANNVLEVPVQIP